MTPKLLLLILALTASLIAPKVHCEKDDGSGDAETETHNTEDITSVTVIQEEAGHIVSIQREVTKPALSYAQVVSQKTTVAVERLHTTQTLNRTKKENFTITTTVLPPESTTLADQSEQPDDLSITVVALVLALVLILAILAAAVLICRRRREKTAALKEDPYLDAEGKEKVPMPMFEDDVPSVMELEMEDLEKWMFKGDGGISMDAKQKQFF